MTRSNASQQLVSQPARSRPTRLPPSTLKEPSQLRVRLRFPGDSGVHRAEQSLLLPLRELGGVRLDPAQPEGTARSDERHLKRGVLEKVVLDEQAGKLGTNRMAKLRDNSNKFRAGLLRLGCRVLGDADSPVVPIMLYHPEKIYDFSQAC